MEPSKFEKHFKKKLQEREIAPSEEVWAKIADKLDMPIKSRDRGLLWYAVAAFFTGIVIFSIAFLNDETNVNSIETQIVETPENPNSPKNKMAPLSEKENEVQVAMEETKEEILKSTAAIATHIVNEESNELHVEEDFIAEVATATSRQAPIKDDQIPNISEADLEAKIVEMVAVVDQLERGDSSLTDDEIDSLLRKAQREILKEKVFKESGKIDALTLLSEVETDLDQSFRDQIFENLKNGFLKVRTAVADRNN